MKKLFLKDKNSFEIPEDVYLALWTSGYSKERIARDAKELLAGRLILEGGESRDEMRNMPCKYDFKKRRVWFKNKGKAISSSKHFLPGCSCCGEKVLSPDVSQTLYEKIQNGQFKKENISIPVLDGAYS